MSTFLDEKFAAWQLSLSNGDNFSSSKETSKTPGKEEGQDCSESSASVLTVTDSWSPDYARAMQQVERTKTLTKALTRSHSKVLVYIFHD